jgi:dTDP-4-dehydrorhamnose 3,5-epimerase
MIFTRLAIPDVVLVTPAVHGDARGYFMEVWHDEKFAAAGLALSFVQDNQSRSRGGILRGLHFQIERPQGKLVRVVSGEIFDVAVDLRSSSPTFGRWVGRLLSDENKEQLYVPPGFAHGFLVTSDSADVVYKCTDFYFPEQERTLAWDDDTVGIAWPLVEGQAPTLSAKDRSGAALRDLETFG